MHAFITKFRLQVGQWTLGLFWGILTALMGCDQSQPAVNQEGTSRASAEVFVKTSTPIQVLLNQCVQRYQSLNSYQDRAVVELHYQLNGQPIVDRAPIHIAWDRSGRLGLRVYSLVAGPTDSERWRLRIMGGQEGLRHQVLSRQIPTQMTFDWLLSDPVVGEELSAGLAGFPPQLDLLLSRQPLEGLMRNATHISMGPTQAVDGNNCTIVEFEVGPLVYHLWLDQESKLLRRMELPVQNLPADILQDSRISDLRLRINLEDIQMNHSISWSSWKVPTNQGDQLLTRFVSPPPPINLNGYGKVVPAFQLRDPSGRISYDSRPRSARKASVLVWLADDPSCQVAAGQLSRAMHSLRQNGLSNDVVEFVCVWAEPTPPDGLTFEQLSTEWQMPGNLVVDNAAAGRDLFHIEEAPTLIVLDESGVLQLRDVRTNPLLDIALPTLIQKIVHGDSLAQEVLAAKTALERRFQAELSMAAASDQRPELTLPALAYAPGQTKMAEVGRRKFPSKVRLLFQDANATPWVLLADGTLSCLDASLASGKSFPTSWSSSTWDQTNEGTSVDNPVVSENTKVVPSQDGRLFAHHTARKNGRVNSTVEIFDSKTGQETTLLLPSGSFAIDLRWLGANHRNLAVITDSKQTVLYHWETQQRFSGNSPQQPVSLVDFAELVVLEDGTVEPIQLIHGETTSKSNSEYLTSLESRGRAQSLGFMPLSGSWGVAKTQNGWQMLVPGLLHSSEPVYFLMDENLNRIGHYPLPTRYLKEGAGFQISHAKSPGDGVMLWAILEPNGTIHLVRGDAGWADHFRSDEPITGICLTPAGDRLNLLLSTHSEVTAFQLH